MLKCVRLRLLRAECFDSWDLSRTRSQVGSEPGAQVFGQLHSLGLEDPEQEARTLNFWTPVQSGSRLTQKTLINMTVDEDSHSNQAKEIADGC